MNEKIAKKAAGFLRNSISREQFAPLTRRLADHLDPLPVDKLFHMMPNEFLKANNINDLYPAQLENLIFHPDENGIHMLLLPSGQNGELIKKYISYIAARFNSPRALTEDMTERAASARHGDF